MPLLICGSFSLLLKSYICLYKVCSRVTLQIVPKSGKLKSDKVTGQCCNTRSEFLLLFFGATSLDKPSKFIWTWAEWRSTRETSHRSVSWKGYVQRSSHRLHRQLVSHPTSCWNQELHQLQVPLAMLWKYQKIDSP